LDAEDVAIAALAELKDVVRHFIDDREFDRVAFAKLVRTLRDLPLEQRKVAYAYLLRETISAASGESAARSRALARISDLIGKEPPEIGEYLGPRLRVAAP
jgi:hypothetical protein